MKRKKNAGLGYGFQFHGAFVKKSDAQKKERQRKGSFIKSSYGKQGHRYLVLSPRTNPRKRKPKVAVAANPTELLVMGANPPHSGGREFVVPAGSTITIRTEP